jgi:hypothetical protein
LDALRTDTYGPTTTEEHLRTLRRYLMDARELVYSVDEGETSDGFYKTAGGVENSSVLAILNNIDSAILDVAGLIDGLRNRN